MILALSLEDTVSLKALSFICILLHILAKLLFNMMTDIVQTKDKMIIMVITLEKFRPLL